MSSRDAPGRTTQLAGTAKPWWTSRFSPSAFPPASAGSSAPGSMATTAGPWPLKRDRPVRAVHHLDSWHDAREEPVPGLVPYGPLRFKTRERGLNWTHSWGQATFDPPAREWPNDELWCGNYMSPAAAEFTVHETIGPAAAAYAYLWAVSRPGS